MPVVGGTGCNRCWDTMLTQEMWRSSVRQNVATLDICLGQWTWTSFKVLKVIVISTVDSSIMFQLGVLGIRKRSAWCRRLVHVHFVYGKCSAWCTRGIYVLITRGHRRKCGNVIDKWGVEVIPGGQRTATLNSQWPMLKHIMTQGWGSIQSDSSGLHWS